MRVIALAVYVFFMGSFAFAEGSESANGPAQTWASVHERGLGADSRRSYSEAAELFRQCWPLAASPLEQAITSNDLGRLIAGWDARQTRASGFNAATTRGGRSPMPARTSRFPRRAWRMCGETRGNTIGRKQFYGRH
jgi:hypothetical protein